MVYVCARVCTHAGDRSVNLPLYVLVTIYFIAVKLIQNDYASPLKCAHVNTKCAM